MATDFDPVEPDTTRMVEVREDDLRIILDAARATWRSRNEGPQGVAPKPVVDGWAAHQGVLRLALDRTREAL